jgi:type IV pilus assembly protein PilO
MASLTRTRAWVAGTVVLCLLLVVASYFLLIGPKRAEAADLDLQTESTLSSNAALEVRVAELKAQFAELPDREAELAAVRRALPQDAAIPTLVRDLDALAAAQAVTLMSVTPGVGTVVVDPTAVVAAPAAPADGAAPAEGAAPADGAAAAPTDPAAAAAVPAGDVLLSVPTSLVVVGGFAEAETFLEKLQTELARAFLVSSLTVTAETTPAAATGGKPAVDVGDVTMTITGSVFVLRSPDAAAVDPITATAPGAATPGEPAAPGTTTDAPGTTTN